MSTIAVIFTTIYLTMSVQVLIAEMADRNQRSVSMFILYLIFGPVCIISDLIVECKRQKKFWENYDKKYPKQQRCKKSNGRITLLAAVFLSILAASCERGLARFNKKFQSSERNYEVIMYSGGDTVFYDTFRGIVNSDSDADGYYYYKGDTLIEISGDCVLRSTK